MRILLVSTTQLGYLTDYHRYYDHLRAEGHLVRFICWEHARPRLDDNPYHVLYVSREGSKWARTNRLMKAVIQLEKAMNFDRIMVGWFPFCTKLLASIPKEKLYLDVRTVNVHPDPLEKKIHDMMIQQAARLFKHVSVISNASAEQIGIKKYSLLPLGGAVLCPIKSVSEPVNFLYVGTLHLRRIIECVKGFHRFLRSMPQVDCRLTIVGDAIHNELNEINDYIRIHHLAGYITTTGYVPQQDLPKYFAQADFGICYIPLTKAFTVQPATKTYEYLVNGIPIIATKVQDNVRVFKTARTPVGELCDDNQESFEKALMNIVSNRAMYNRRLIAQEFKPYQWDAVLSNNLLKVLNIQKADVLPIAQNTPVVQMSAQQVSGVLS